METATISCGIFQYQSIKATVSRASPLWLVDDLVWSHVAVSVDAGDQTGRIPAAPCHVGERVYFSSLLLL